MLYEFHIIKDTKKSKKTLKIERDDVILRGMETDITTLTSLAVTETEKRLLEIILKKDTDSYKRGTASSPAGCYVPFDDIQRVRCVFRVDPHEIESTISSAFAYSHIGQGDHGSDCSFTRSDCCLEFFQMIDLHIFNFFCL